MKAESWRWARLPSCGKRTATSAACWRPRKVPAARGSLLSTVRLIPPPFRVKRLREKRGSREGAKSAKEAAKKYTRICYCDLQGGIPFPNLVKCIQGHTKRLAHGAAYFGVDHMAKTPTSRYDVAEHLRTPEEMAAYLEASLAEANGDA